MSNCKFHYLAIAWTIVISFVVVVAYQQGAKSCSTPAKQAPVVASPTTQPTTNPSRSAAIEEIYNNHNVLAVQSGPSSDTTFTLTSPRTISSIQTYHWNNAQGSNTTGTIGLTSKDGTTYGPWSTTGSDGQGGVPNAYWTAQVEQELPAGTYTVVDSDPATWAHNDKNGNQGMVRIYGYTK